MNERKRLTESERFRRESDRDYGIGCAALLLLVLLILAGLILDQLDLAGVI